LVAVQFIRKILRVFMIKPYRDRKLSVSLCVFVRRYWASNT
jgi:hypothetical protein